MAGIPFSATVDVLGVTTNLLPMQLRLRAAVGQCALSAAAASPLNPLAQMLTKAQVSPCPANLSLLCRGHVALNGTLLLPHCPATHCQHTYILASIRKCSLVA